MRLEEQEASKQFIQRLFTNSSIKFSDNLPYDQWMLKAGDDIRNYIQQLEVNSNKVLNLESVMQQYRTVIDSMVSTIHLLAFVYFQIDLLGGKFTNVRGSHRAERE